MPVLTGIDILGIQRYVFASNRLRDVLAASWIVDHVTKRDSNSLVQWGMMCNRVLLAAGGNAIVGFDTLEDAHKWTAHYTRWVQDTAPGLEVVVAHRDFGGRPLAWALKALSIKLARAKLERRPSAPQLGLSVTAACSVTGLPASKRDENNGDPISPRIATLRSDDIQRVARERWQSFRPVQLDHAPAWSAEFPDELDLMGRTRGETSLLGLVHVDGNSVGQSINDWLDRCLEAGVGDENVRAEYREWSTAIRDLGDAVLRAIVTRAATCVREETNERGRRDCFVRGTPDELAFRLCDWRADNTRKTSNGTLFLPIRPILLGGDDLTFVCDGRIALDLAVTAMREIEKHPIPHLAENGGELTLTACAGVALVKAHAPFRRSYDLAESLCASAKRTRREINKEQDAETGSWLDWHVGSTRPGESIEEIRERQYQRGRRTLTMRPYPLVNHDGRDQSWHWLEQELLGPGNGANESFRGFSIGKDEGGQIRLMPDTWSGSRSRVKRLGSLVCDGSDGIKRQVEAWNALEPGIRLPASLPDGGFIGQQTPLIDAVELLDMHIRLEPDPRAVDPSVTALAKEEEIR